MNNTFHTDNIYPHCYKMTRERPTADAGNSKKYQIDVDASKYCKIMENTIYGVGKRQIKLTALYQCGLQNPI